MRIDAEVFPEDKYSWKWQPKRWIIGLFSFWVINILLMLIYSNYSVFFVFLLLLLFMIFAVSTYREGYQSLFAYRIWLFLGLFYSGLLFWGLDYLAKITLVNLVPSASVIKIKQIIGLMAVTPFVIWSMRMSKYFVEQKDEKGKRGN